LPSFSTGLRPRRDLARLADCIKSSGTPAIFLKPREPQLAEQLAQRRHPRVTGYTATDHTAGGNAPIIFHDEVQYQAIVNALK
jgi:hypothetical protein